MSEVLHTEHAQKQSGLLVFALHPGSCATALASSAVPDVYKHILVDAPSLAADTCVYLVAHARDRDLKWLGGRFVSCTWDVEDLQQMRETIVEKDMLKMRLVL